MSTQPASPPRCLQCNKPLTYMEWFEGDCPKALYRKGGFAMVGHFSPIPGALLPLREGDAPLRDQWGFSLEAEAPRETP